MTQVPILPRNVVIPLGLVDSVFPQVTRVVSIGPDETSVGNPKATISVIYGNSDSSLKLTITIDEYRSSQYASSAFEQALEASEKVPGFHPIRAPKLGWQHGPQSGRRHDHQAAELRPPQRQGLWLTVRRGALAQARRRAD